MKTPVTMITHPQQRPSPQQKKSQRKQQNLQLTSIHGPINEFLTAAGSVANFVTVSSPRKFTVKQSPINKPSQLMNTSKLKGNGHEYTNSSSAFELVVPQVLQALWFSQTPAYHELAQQNQLPKHLPKQKQIKILCAHSKKSHQNGEKPMTPRPPLPARFQSLQNG